MPAIIRDAVDNRPYPPARDARVQCKYGAYHATFEVRCQMVLQIRDVLHRPAVVNTPVILVSSTLEAVKGMFFVENMQPLIFHPRFLCAKHQVTNKRLVEKLVWNLDRFHVLHVFVHLPRQIHQSRRRIDNTLGVRVDTLFDSVSQLSPVEILDMSKMNGFHHNLVVQLSFLPPST